MTGVISDVKETAATSDVEKTAEAEGIIEKLEILRKELADLAALVYVFLTISVNLVSGYTRVLNGDL